MMLRLRIFQIALLALCGSTWVVNARAEKADRAQPMVVESDGRQAGSVDLARKVTVFSGHVVVMQGSLRIEADRVEVRETANGQFMALAKAAPGGLVQFRQKRDRPGESIDAQGESVDYDGGREQVKFSGQARLRVLRDGSVANEATASAITYDQRADTILFDGGSAAAGPAAGAASAPGRARLVFTPRSEAPASAPAATGASR